MPETDEHQDKRAKKPNWVEKSTLVISAIALLVVTFYACEASKQRIAMEQSVETANNTLRFSQRAFVYFDAVKFQIRSDEKTNQDEWDIVGGIGNAGNTPTRNMIYNLGCNSNLKEIDIFFRDWTNAKPYFLGPKVIINPTVCTFQTTEITNLRNRNRVIYAFGKAKYRDIVEPKEEHVTEFCSEVKITQFKPEGGILKIAGIAAPCPGRRNHNCADDECREEISK